MILRLILIICMRLVAWHILGKWRGIQLFCDQVWIKCKGKHFLNPFRLEMLDHVVSTVYHFILHSNDEQTTKGKRALNFLKNVLIEN